MKPYIICINRQFGSLGRPIALQLAETLGIDYYDRDIVEETAKKMNLPISDVSNEEENVKSSFLRMRFPLGNSTSDKQDEIFRTQRKIILDLAERGSCIIVGRCSEYILRDYENVVSIYIYAPKDVRFDNCVNILHMDPAEAKRMIEEVDKARDAYHVRYAGYCPGDFSHEKIMMDSSFLGAEGTAEYLAELIRKKYGTGS